MSFLQQQLFQFQEKIKAIDPIDTVALKQKISNTWKEGVPAVTSRKISQGKKRLYGLHASVKSIGSSAVMDDYEKRKLGIFNQLNFFQLITGICIPLAGFFNNKMFPEWAWVITSLPAVISVGVLLLNACNKYDTAIIFYFICYPVVTSVVYMSGINAGLELFFILYGILSVFFLQKIKDMLFSLGLSMVSYFMLAVLFRNYRFQLETTNIFLYLFNQFTGIVFIFYGLFLIKKENAVYQSNVLSKNKEIEENSALLHKQTVELTELNGVKNKLFSVIAHDLKAPMYALRNLFTNIQLQKLPAKDIKAVMPDVINNLNYTTGLMENLLQWAKCQMQSEAIKIQSLNITSMATEVVRLLQLQAEAKQIQVECTISGSFMVMADKDMIALVLRNLLSNAIKFTPAQGQVTVGAHEAASGVEIFIKDTGTGMAPGVIQKINRNDYFSTNGTASEPGTGLGLMLCREFLLKNGSRLFIESEPGKGSVFSFSLPVSQ